MTNKERVYCVTGPEKPEIPLIFDSPHSGRIYPADFQYACPREALELAEDNDVDVLFESAPRHGATLLCALFPRTYIDANRAEDDIDMELLAEPWPIPAVPTPRSHAGIGLIRRLVKPGQPVYNRHLSVVEIQHRLNAYYRPYHAALKKLLDEAHYNFGQVWHVNCHSMPKFRMPVTHGILNMQPDFVLGDRDGTSCDLDFTHFLRDRLRDLGYKVAINNPYKGVEIVRRSANPSAGRHSIQIEISKALYWDEKRNVKTNNFNSLQGDLEKIVVATARYATDNLASLAAD